VIELAEPNYNDVHEISNDEFTAKVKIFESTRTLTHGRDGIFVVWGNTYSYRNIDYRIIMVRYFQIGKQIPKPNWLNGYGRWFILECPESSSKIIELHDKIYSSDSPFLNRNLSDYTDITLNGVPPSDVAEVATTLINYRNSAFGGGSGGDVVGIAPSVAGNLPQYTDTTGKEIEDSGESVASLKAYADSLVVGLWDDRGSFDASGGAYPSSGGSGTAGAILKGDIWTISVAGTLPTEQAVEVGDVVRALINTPGNTQGNWAITQNNIGYVAENSANKTDTMAGNTASSIKYLSAKGVYDWAVATFQAVITAATWGDFIVALTAKTTPVDADSMVISDSAASDDAKKTTLSNFYTNWLKPKLDLVYQAILVSGTNIKTVNGTTLLGSGDLVVPRFLNVQFIAYTFQNGATRYFGCNPKQPTTVGEGKIYFRSACTITAAEIFTYANTTAGTNESISIYIRLNTTTDYLIATVGVAAAERVFSNTSLNSGSGITIANGDYVEIKMVFPTFATPPAGVTAGGYLTIK